MNRLIALFPVCLALVGAGYVEHYQGATSFTSFDLKSSPIEGGKVLLSKPTVTYGTEAIKHSTDHAKVISFEAKPVISAVYTAPVTKTVTYSSTAPVHYTAPVPDCPLKDHKHIVPVQTSVAYGGPSQAWSHYGYSTGAQSSSQGYPSFQQQYNPVQSTIASGSYGGSSSFGHSVSHHYTAPSSSVIYTPPKGPSYGAPIVETLVDVVPQKNTPASVSYGVPAPELTVHLATQPKPVVGFQSIAPVKVSSTSTSSGGYATSSGGYATSHQYKTSSTPVKPSRFYVAPVVSAATSSGWKDSNGGLATNVGQLQYASGDTKNHGHSFTTTHSYSAPVQTYLPPKTTWTAGFSASSTSSGAAKETPSTPDREYLPPREYFPPSQEIKGAASSSATYGSVGKVSYEVPSKLTSVKLPQQPVFHGSTVNHHGTASILSPLHVSVHKTPLLVSAPKPDCTQDHRH